MKFISTLVARLSVSNATCKMLAGPAAAKVKSPGLARAWSQAMLNKDEQITVHGYRAKSEPFVMTARTTDLPGGKEAILSAQMMKSPDLIVAERLQKQRGHAALRASMINVHWLRFTLTQQ
jgi:hypothetical protein